MKKEVIFFYPSLDKGGATKILFNIINFFSKKNYKISLITDKKNKSISSKVIIKIIKTNRNIKFIHQRSYYAFLAMIKLIKILKNKDRNNCIIFSMQSHFVSILICKIMGFKVIIRNSEDPFGATKYSKNYFFSIIILIMKYLFYNYSTEIVTNSTVSKNNLKKIILNKKKINLVYNPSIDLIKFKKKKIDNYFIAVGRLDPQKNYELLLQAFSIFVKRYNNYNYKLYIVGHGSKEYTTKLKNLAKKYEIISLVKFYGWTKNTKNLFKEAKIYFLSSFYEGLPNSLIEAVNYEVPAITSNCSGVKDILKNNSGKILDNYDPFKWSIAINEVLMNYQKFKKKSYIAKKMVYRFEKKRNLEVYFKLFEKHFE